MSHTPNTQTPKTSASNPSAQKAKEENDYGKSSKTASELAEDAREDAADGARQAADTVRKAVKDTADTVKQTAADKAAATQESAAERIAKSAEAVDAAARRYPAGSFERAAAERIARTISGAATQVRAADIRSVVSELDGFARRNPAIFAGAAALVGFAVARAMKASERRTDSVASPVVSSHSSGSIG